MSDLETRLRETLAEHAGAAPDAVGLAGGARRRLRRRRTTWAVAAAAVVAAAVPIAMTQLAPSSDRTGRVADTATATSGLPPGVVETGYRAESWRDVTFEVPVDWGYGGATAWCVEGTPLAEARPVVSRPDMLAATILCSPATGFGVTIGSSPGFDPMYESGHVWQFESSGTTTSQYPDGAWLGYWYDDDILVTVVADDLGTARRMVDSVHRFTGADPNRCPATLGEAEAARASEPYDSFSICRYGPDDQLSASRSFIGVDARQVEDAVFSSPRRTADHDCPTEDGLSRTALLSGGGYVATAVTGASCRGWNGLFLSGAVRELTPEAQRHLDLSQLPVPLEE